MRANTLRSIRGMRDVLPEDAHVWSRLEATLEDTLNSFGYQKIRLPVVEATTLFRRSVGEFTDIVEKEMYSFESRDGESLTLRPEGTAGCVRAALQHGLAFNRVSRLWYRGPMFRYERPQKGRYRQFEQVGVEAIGIPSPALDAELIEMNCAYLQRLGLGDCVRLRLNSLGSADARAAYAAELKAYLQARRTELDEDSQRRLDRNPLRILDSKNDATRKILAEAPKLDTFLDADSERHFEALLGFLDSLDIDYRVDPHLVRGLDYYTRTVFEFETAQLGAQGTVSAGGRYDGLVEALGGRPTPAAGFAVGMDRLVLLCKEVDSIKLGPASPLVYCVAADSLSMGYLMRLTRRMREEMADLRFILDTQGGRMGAQMRRADRAGADWAVIAGDRERQSDRLTLKRMKELGEQETLTYDALVARLSGEPLSVRLGGAGGSD